MQVGNLEEQVLSVSWHQDPGQHKLSPVAKEREHVRSQEVKHAG